MNKADAAEFDQFWSAFPRKVGKLAAQREWQTLKPPIEAVIAALAWQVKEWPDRRFIPHPRTWLHQGRWMDEPVAVEQGETTAEWMARVGYK